MTLPFTDAASAWQSYLKHVLAEAVKEVPEEDRDHYLETGFEFFADGFAAGEMVGQAQRGIAVDVHVLGLDDLFSAIDRAAAGVAAELAKESGDDAGQ